jgi:hypothetical protein
VGYPPKQPANQLFQPTKIGKGILGPKTGRKNHGNFLKGKEAVRDPKQQTKVSFLLLIE